MQREQLSVGAGDVCVCVQRSLLMCLFIGGGGCAVREKKWRA